MNEINHYRMYSMLSKAEKGLVIKHLSETFKRSTHHFKKKLNRRNNQKLTKEQKEEFSELLKIL